MSDDIRLPHVPSEDEIAALALLKEYAAADLKFRLSIYTNDGGRLEGGAIDRSARREILRGILDDLARTF